MFERFTGRARRAVVPAEDDARAPKHGLLLGLARENEGAAARILLEVIGTIPGRR